MITNFLKTKKTKKDLKVALEVLREFRSHETNYEYLAIPFVAWAKLEQLEEFLDYLVNKEPLKQDTLAYIKSAVHRKKVK